MACLSKHAQTECFSGQNQPSGESIKLVANVGEISNLTTFYLGRVKYFLKYFYFKKFII